MNDHPRPNPRTRRSTEYLGTPPDPMRRFRIVLGIIAGIMVLAMIVIGVIGLLRGPAPETVTPEPSSSHAEPTSADPAPLPQTRAPEAFARAVAERLFSWDTGGDAGPADYMQPLVDAAHDSEPVALASDLRGYFPDQGNWGELRHMQVRQWLTIDRAVIPDAWAIAQAQARPGQLPEGSTAYTIDGTRQRTGIRGTEPVRIDQPVAFTVFVVCPPAASCTLLRLSALDQPLR